MSSPVITARRQDRLTLAAAVWLVLRLSARPALAEQERAEVHVDADTQARIGLVVEAVQAATRPAVLRALGRIEENPAQSFTLRAPWAGFVDAPGGWPVLGAHVDDAAVVGQLRPRVTALEQVALQQQAIDAQGAVEELEAELAAAQASFAGKRSLSEGGQMVSERTVEESEARVKSAEARLSAARRKLDVLKHASEAAVTGLEPVPLTLGRGGDVVEVLAAPGEAVESGQALLRVVSFKQTTALVELPLGEAWDPQEGSALVSPFGMDSGEIPAALIGPSGRAAATTHGEAWLFALSGTSTRLRPGAPVVAYLPGAGEPQQGVMVPRSAVIRYDGRAWVYVQVNEDGFERRPVELLQPTETGWLAAGEVAGGEKVVVTGAQELLSEQLKEEIEREEEAAE